MHATPPEPGKLVASAGVANLCRACLHPAEYVPKNDRLRALRTQGRLIASMVKAGGSRMIIVMNMYGWHDARDRPEQRERT
eukprot:8061246-Alexandrium_andersonii.AAC.1